MPGVFESHGVPNMANFLDALMTHITTSEQQNPIQRLLRARWMYHAGALVLTSMFWGSGIGKALDFAGTMGEMAHFGLYPPALFTLLTILVQLGGSLLLVSGNRFAWLGAGALAVFTLATIPVALRFWEMQGPAAFMTKMTVFEHVTVVGALAVAAIAAELRRD